MNLSGVKHKRHFDRHGEVVGTICIGRTTWSQVNEDDRSQEFENVDWILFAWLKRNERVHLKNLMRL